VNIETSIPVELLASRDAADSEETNRAAVFRGRRTRSCAIGRRHLKHSKRTPEKDPGMPQNDWNGPVTLADRRADVLAASNAPATSLEATKRSASTSSSAENRCRAGTGSCRAKMKRGRGGKLIHSYACPRSASSALCLRFLPTLAFLFFFRTDSTDSPHCLPTLLSISGFLVFSFLLFSLSVFRF